MATVVVTEVAVNKGGNLDYITAFYAKTFMDRYTGLDFGPETFYTQEESFLILRRDQPKKQQFYT